MALGVGTGASERARDREVSETGLAVPSNQDVALGVPSVNVQAH